MKKNNVALLKIISIYLITLHISNSSELDDFESLYLNSTLNEWTWLTAHNSHLNSYDNSVIDLASNQNLSIDEQLKNGVRGFMFDIDFLKCSFKSSLIAPCKCEGVCLCHGECATSFDPIKDGFSIKKLEYALKKLVTFLQKNKNEIITIFFENYVTDKRKIQHTFNRVKNFNNLIFDPYNSEWNVLKNGWPKIKELVRANKRIIIFDYEKKGIN